MIRRTALPLLLISATLSAWSSPARCQDAGGAELAGRVVSIADGDTLAVLRADRTQVKIRLHGIDSPETGQDFGNRAKEAAAAMAFGKDVIIRPVDRDKYGRTVAEVILPDGRSMNHELVRDGWAWWYREYAPKDRELERLESEAKSANRGLWSQPNPVAPWEWRKPKAERSGSVIGNKNSHLYHASNCPGAAKMKAVNRVTFKTAKEAETAGCRKAGDCR
jgi:micrococcal nuclease